MKITRTSELTGNVHSMDINITSEQLNDLYDPNRTMTIQEMFPLLTPDEREFLLTGITKEEWDNEVTGDFSEPGCTVDLIK